MKRTLAIPTLLVTIASGASRAEVHTPPERRDHPVTVQATVVFDPATHLYTYSYSVTNPSGNPRPVNYFSILLQPGVDVITDAVHPKDWTFRYRESDGVARWAGTETADYIPADYVDDGHSVPPFGPWIQPGATLAGFSFKSFSPPGAGQGISQTFAPIPWADDAEELADLPYASTLPEDNGYRFATTTPVPDADWDGNRRPSVDGFLVFANVSSPTSFTGSAMVVIRFAAGGESVQTDTFRATLNAEDVTSLFQYSATYKGYVARFEPGSSPLATGNNVLLTSVLGTIPGIIDKPAKDTDRLAFKFAPQ